ncbi:hypothetical protein K3495_g6363 [Podosphaera aphanis]|nr:hypothetical protein K3495_g6363 [Podosphaera aphanis]
MSNPTSSSAPQATSSPSTDTVVPKDFFTTIAKEYGGRSMNLTHVEPLEGQSNYDSWASTMDAVWSTLGLHDLVIEGVKPVDDADIEEKTEDIRFIAFASWQDQASVNDEQYENLRKIVLKYYKIKLPYLKKKSSRLTKLSSFTSTTYECCRESYAADTGADKDATECRGSSKKVGATHKGCNLPRWKTDKHGNRVPYKQFDYIPLIPRLVA